MTVFIDASAMVAMIAKEPEGKSFGQFVNSYEVRLTSPIAVWEAVRGVEGARGIDFSEARQLVETFIVEAAIEIVPIDALAGELALNAHQRYGKGVSRAKLNLGDCFAYACAKRYSADILFKGEDFIHTDLRDASLP